MSKLSDYPYQLLAQWIAQDPQAWTALADIETKMVSRWLPPVTAPIYICGQARAGTTILTEAIARLPQVATHTYRDFPCIFTPYFWNRLLLTFDWVPHKPKPRERAHKDGIMVTSRSPEAMEEMLWVAFFRNLHNELHSAVLGSHTANPERDRKFAEFYRSHIQKLLLARKRSRYASKANYNVTRIPYILTIFPDARFVIVVRNPESLVWSSYQKDTLFRSEQERNPASLLHMDQTGHFEFGKHRTLIHTGDDAFMASVRECFAAGEDIRGWARYWTMLHRFIRDSCQGRPEVLVVRHEDLCAHPEDKLREIFYHCHLEYDIAALSAAAGTLRDTAAPVIPQQMRDIIREETAGVAAAWGYNSAL